MPDLENPVVTDDATTPDVAPETPTINYYHPEWFSHGEYLNNKVIECDLIAFQDKTDWNNTSVLAALTAAGQSPYENWVEYGNANNVSPSPFFNVPQYLQFKANQLNSFPFMDEVGWLGHRPATGTVWTMMDVLESFREAGLSAWDHYTQYGQFENINPSNNFDQAAFWTAKAAQLNAWENADGTTGFDGKTDWDEQAVKDYFQANNLNAIMNLYDNSKEDQQALINQVAPLQQVETNGWQPWGDHVYPLPIDYTDVVMTADKHEYTGTDGNENFVAVVGNNADTTLHQEDVIDGGAGQDMLTVAMSANFKGFKDPGKMVNVETVTLNNANTNASQKGYEFNAQNTGDVQHWILNEKNGTFKLTNLAKTGIEVDVNDAAGGQITTIGFANHANSAPNDSMTLNVKNVGTAAHTTGSQTTAASAAIVQAAGIETLTIAATGNNILSLGDTTSDVEDLVITGNGDLELSGVGDELETFDASAARGKIVADLSSSTSVKTVDGGLGNDEITVANVPTTLDGGAGTDTLVYTGTGNFAPTMSGFEEVKFNATSGSVTLNAANITDLATMTLDGGVSVTAVNLDNIVSPFTVNDLGTGHTAVLNGGSFDLNYVAKGTSPAHNTTNLTAYTDGAVTISDSGTAVLGGDFTLDQASEVTINAANIGSIATLNAGDATQLTVNADTGLSIGTGSLADLETITINSNSGNGPSASNDFVHISANLGGQSDSIEMDLNGTGAIILDGNIGGASTNTVEIDASGAYNGVRVGSANAAAATNAPDKIITTDTLDYTGGFGADLVYASVNGATTSTISTGAGDDIIDITLTGGRNGNASNPNAILDGGSGDDIFYVRTPGSGQTFVQIDNWNLGDKLNVTGTPLDWDSFTASDARGWLNAFYNTTITEDALPPVNIEVMTNAFIVSGNSAYAGTYVTGGISPTTAGAYMICLSGVTSADELTTGWIAGGLS